MRYASGVWSVTMKTAKVETDPLARGRRALCRGDHAGDGRADRRRTIRTIRSPRSSAPTRASLRSAPDELERSDWRRCAHAGERRGAPLPGPRAAEARACLPGLLPLLLPARNGRAARRRHADRRRARRGARLHRSAPGNLGSDPHRRRSVPALRAPRAGDHRSGSRRFRT